MAMNGSYVPSYMPSCTGPNVSGAPMSSVEGLLEASIPGFSLVSGIARNYLHWDISAIISTLLPIAAVIAAIRYIYGPLCSYFWQYGVSTAEIRNDDEMYNYLMYWISQQRFSAKTISFVAGTRTSSDLLYDPYDDDDESSKGRDVEDDWELAEQDFDKYWAQSTAREKVKSIYFTPRDGTHWFRYQGHYLALTRETQEQRFGRFSDKREQLSISCFGRDGSIIKDLLKAAQKLYIERDGTRTVVYRKASDCDDWSRCMSRPPRPLSTVVLDPRQKDAIVDDIKEYLHPLTRRWYANRGIPYRRGYLLYGPPGTGKTSLCVALAGLFGLKVYVTSLNSRMLTEESLATLFGYLPDRCVVLLEDVDSAGIATKRGTDPPASSDKDKAREEIEAAAGARPASTSSTTAPSGGISLSGLLNVIDGVASSEGRILIMTTNHVEKLDPALLRPGRVDMSIAFENANTETAKNLFKSTYVRHEEDYPHPPRGEAVKTTARKFDFSDAEIEKLATKFADQLPSGEFSPADIQGYLLKHKSTPALAAEGAPEWIIKTREEKLRRKNAAGTQAETPKGTDTPVLV